MYVCIAVGGGRARAGSFPRELRVRRPKPMPVCRLRKMVITEFEEDILQLFNYTLYCI